MNKLIVKQLDILPELRNILSGLDQANHMKWETEKDYVHRAKIRLDQLLRLIDGGEE